jgi:hypothetical protein
MDEEMWRKAQAWQAPDLGYSINPLKPQLVFATMRTFDPSDHLTSYMAEIMYISCLCATPEGSIPPSILANDYLMLPTLLFFVILADGGSTKY